MKLRKLYEDVLKESYETRISAYHGTDYDIDKFSDSFVSGDRNIQHHGAGIYFATNYENARMFGKNVYHVELVGNFISDTAPVEDADSEKLIQLMKLKDEDEWELHAQDYHPDPETGLMVALEDALDQENEAAAYMRIQNGWYPYDALDYIRAMTKIGIDGVIVTPPRDWADKGEKHIIMFNPNAIKFIEKIPDDVTEDVKIKNLSDDEEFGYANDMVSQIGEELTYRHTNTKGVEDDEYEIGMVKEGNDGNYAYHVGDLKEKSESIGDKAHGARMLAKNGFGKASKTGHFGAGHFFFGSLEKAQEFQKSKNMPIYIIDFDKYNLYKPNNPEEFVSGVIELTNKLIMVPDNYINDPEFKQLIKDLSEDLPYFGINLNINKIYQITRDFVIDVTTNSNPSGDYLITRYLKAVNFEGIDFRNTKYDSFYVGSVIYDIKPNTVKLYK